MFNWWPGCRMQDYAGALALAELSVFLRTQFWLMSEAAAFTSSRYDHNWSAGDQL